MESKFDESTCRAHYRWLAHAEHGVTELVVISGDNKPLRIGFFDDEDAFVEACRFWHGKRNVYVGVQPRRRELFDRAPNVLRCLRDGATRDDIGAITAVYLDLDVKTKEKKAAERRASGMASSTNQEHADTVAAAKWVAQWDTFHHPVLLSSGNGGAILVAVDLKATKDMGGRLKALENEVRAHYAKLVAGHNTGIDATADLPRLMPVAGTLKCKGPDSRRRPHRVVHFLDGLPNRTVDHELSHYIERLEPSWIDSKMPPSGAIELSLTKDLRPLQQLCEAWNAVFTSVDRDAQGRRNKVLYFLCAELQRRGFSHDTIFEALLLHDRHLGRKFCDRREPRAYVDELILRTTTFTKPFLCEVASTLAGDLHCVDCDEDDAEEPRVPPFMWVGVTEQSEEGADVSPEPVSKDFAADIIEAHVDAFLRKVDASPGETRTLLIKGVPGIKKTTTVAKKLVTFRSPSTGAPIKFSFCVDRTDRFDEIERIMRSGRRAVPLNFIKGKLAKNSDKRSPRCRFHKRLTYLRRLNYGADEGKMICGSCGDRRRCEHFKQFEDTESSRVLVIHHLFAGNAALANDPDVIVVDEDLVRHVISQKIEVRGEDISRLQMVMAQVPFESEDLTSFLGALGRALETATIDEGALFRHDLDDLLGDLLAVCKRLQNDKRLSKALEFVKRDFDLGRLPKRFLIDLLRVLEEEERCGALNSRLNVEPDEGGNRLVIRDPRLPSLQGKPVIILDSTADIELYKQILGRDIEVVDPVVDLRPRVVQLVSAAYPKSSLAYTRLRKRLFTVVKAIVDHRPNGEVGVITFKAFEKELRDNVSGARTVRTAHFWGLRGSNAMARCTDLVVIGTPTINIDDLAAWGSALHWKDDPLHCETVRRHEPTGYVRGDGKQCFVEVLHYLDHRLDALLQQGREAELAQAAFRGRPLDEPATKTIWLLTSTPVPWLRPTEVYESIDDLMVALGHEPKTKPLVDQVIELVREAEARGIRLSYDDLMEQNGASRSTVKRAIRRHREGE